MGTYKSVNGYEGRYEISDNGELKRLARKTNGGEKVSEKNLSQSISKNGYMYVRVYLDGFRERFLIHQLVAKHFIPNPDNLPCINHKDGNKLNNHVSNLEWCTVAHNNKHAFETGLTPKIESKGEKNHSALFKDSLVQELKREYYSTGVTCGGIANRYNATTRTISEFINGTTYGHLPPVNEAYIDGNNIYGFPTWGKVGIFLTHKLKSDWWVLYVGHENLFVDYIAAGMLFEPTFIVVLRKP